MTIVGGRISLVDVKLGFNAFFPLFFPLDAVAESPPVAVPPESLVKATPAASVAPQDASSLVNLLSKVDVSPVDLLSALSKVQKQSSFDGENFQPRNDESSR